MYKRQVITCDSLSQLLDAIARLPEKPVGEVNFFSSGARGYLETPTSDLMALFMGGAAQVPCWLRVTISYSASKIRFMPVRPRILSKFMNPCSKPARITDKYFNASCVPRRRPAMCRQIGR